MAPKSTIDTVAIHLELVRVELARYANLHKRKTDDYSSVLARCLQIKQRYHEIRFHVSR